jgi:hypothetical protein
LENKTRENTLQNLERPISFVAEITFLRSLLCIQKQAGFDAAMPRALQKRAIGIPSPACPPQRRATAGGEGQGEGGFSLPSSIWRNGRVAPQNTAKHR